MQAKASRQGTNLQPEGRGHSKMLGSLWTSLAGLCKIHKPDLQGTGIGISQSPFSMQTHIEVVKLTANRYI